MGTEETEPAGKVWICPACGTRYDAPTTCTNQHAPTAALEYDLTAAEVAAEAEEETAEETEAPAEVAAPAEPVVTGAAPVEVPDPTGLAAAFSALDDAVAGLKTKLGL